MQINDDREYHEALNELEPVTDLAKLVESLRQNFINQRNGEPFGLKRDALTEAIDGFEDVASNIRFSARDLQIAIESYEQRRKDRAA